MNKLKKTTITLICVMCSSFMMTANAAKTVHTDNAKQKVEKKGIKIGLNAVYADKAFTNYKSGLELLPSAFYEGTKIYARGDHLGYKFKETAKETVNDEYSIYAQYAGEAYNPTKSSAEFQRLNEKKSTVMLGLSYLKVTPYGGFRIQAAADVMGDSAGKTANLAYLAKFGDEGLRKLRLYPTLGIQWHDKKYNDHYYGISAAEAQNSTLDYYGADSSYHPYISVSGFYDINDDIGIFLNQNIDFYSQTQQDSPKIDGGITFASALGVTYQF